MHAYCEFPHVAMPMPLAPAPEPAGSAASELILDRARCVLKELARLSSGDDDDAPEAAIGSLLVHPPDAETAEQVRAMLFDPFPEEPEPRPLAKRISELFRFYTPEEADELASSNPAKRLRLVALKGSTTEMHIVRPSDPEACSHVTITFGSVAPKASIVLSSDVDLATSSTRVVAQMCPSGGGKRTTWSAILDAAEARSAAALLFDPNSPLPPNLPLESDAATLQRGQGNRVVGYQMPAWFCEHVASLAQEGFRLCALLSAAQRTGASRLFRLDHVVLRWYGEGRKRTALLRAVLHGSSARCVCAAHLGEPPEAQAQNVVLYLGACGQPIASDAHHGRCPTHEKYDAQESERFAGCCTRSVRAFLSCEHVRPESAKDAARSPNPGIRLQMPVDAHFDADDKNQARVEAHARNHAAVEELVACAVALSRVADELEASDGNPGDRAHSQSRVQELRRLCDEVMHEFESEWAYFDGGPEASVAKDVRTRDLLVAGTKNYLPTLAATHAHLFPSYRGGRSKSRRG